MINKLYNDEIKVWNIAFDEQLYKQLVPYYYTLSNKERDKSNSFKFEWNKKLYVFTHIILRLIISDFTGIKPEFINFHYNKYGKPFITPDNLNFNISHSKDIVSIAISTDEIGIDIEYIDPAFNVHEVMNIALSDNEREVIKKLDYNLQRKQFFLYWTQKEALLKAIGTGITSNLNRLQIIPNYGENGFYNSTYKFKKWKIKTFEVPDSNYVGHIAYKNDNNIKYYGINMVKSLLAA